MSKKDLLTKLWDIGQKIVESKGFELVDMEFVKDMGNRYLSTTLTNRAG